MNHRSSDFIRARALALVLLAAFPAALSFAGDTLWNMEVEAAISPNANLVECVLEGLPKVAGVTALRKDVLWQYNIVPIKFKSQAAMEHHGGVHRVSSERAKIALYGREGTLSKAAEHEILANLPQLKVALEKACSK